MSFVEGDTIGPYRILEKLGQGGMATVFKAYHAALDRYVALKALHPAFLEDPNFLARFQREARVVANLEHANIVPIYDYAEHDGRPYLVMKYIEGETLKERLKRGPIEQTEILQIVETVGSALNYAHQQGILHRDVKPSNVLLAKDGRIYLADFGLARIAQAGESTLSADVMLGTPQYISPEQAMGQQELDAGTDIYSFGVVLYELIVGRVPFNADTPYSIVHDHIYAPLPLPHTLNPGVSDAMERVLLKALAKDRTDRFSDVVALVEAFTQVSVSQEGGDQSETESLEVDQVITGREDLTGTGAGIDSSQSVDKPIPVPPESVPSSVYKATSTRKLRWYIGIPILLLALFFCIVVSLLVVRRWRFTRGEISANETTNEVLDLAMQRVKEKPDDPAAHFDLALIFGDAKRLVLAQREFDSALELAGDDFSFYEYAGAQLVEREAWTQAAQVYLQMAQVHPPPLPPELIYHLREAVYKASKLDVASETLLFSDLREVDALLASVAQARNELYFGRLFKAQTIITAVLRRKEDFAEARLVQAEIYMRSRLPRDANPILEELMRDETIPPWIREEAQLLYQDIEQ